MKRRVLSFIVTLALCLDLCPVWALADGGGTDSSLCPHHPAHTDECGYVPESPDTPCTFACRICPVEDLIGTLPDSVSENNSEQVRLQLGEIYALYDGLTADEQQQVDLSRCLFLQEQLDGTGIAALSDDSGSTASDSSNFNMTGDFSYPVVPFEIPSAMTFNTNGYTFTGPDSTAIRVKETGMLYLKGTVISKKSAGVEVLSGGFLSITEPDTSITGTTYALDIASGTEVHLSTGRYAGRTTAIRTADGDLAKLLEPGYAYFDGNGNPLLPAAAAKAKILVIDRCPDHLGRGYAPIPGAAAHTWACPYCGAGETEGCTFTFDQDGSGNGTCALCGSSIAITVDESDLTDLVYDGDMKAENVSITVTVDSSPLTKDIHYKVDYEPRKDAGEITVTVTGIQFNGTFTRTYTVKQDQPGIEWDDVTCTVPYNSAGLDSSSLPGITITIKATEDLHPYLEYSYKSAGDAEFTDGLPTNAGTYEIRAYIPESLNYKAAETDPNLTLTISKIPALVTAPQAAPLTYDGNFHELVTAGVVEDGAVIEYARDPGGPYSTDIPTGKDAGSYTVYYRVADTDNYTGVTETAVSGVEILRKKIRPVVTLSRYTYQYDGEFKQPEVEVRDVDHVTVLLDTEYKVDYSDNRNVGKAKVTVTDLPGGNYELETVVESFEITSRAQEALSITNKPNTVIYGVPFTLSTQGGSGNGDVTWEITDGAAVARVDPNSGLITVTGVGPATVRATKSGQDPATGVVNYDDATASWTFNAEKKPVTATVTADDKIYDGNTAAVVHAVVEQGVVSGDAIKIDVTGAFSDAGAGEDKIVTVDTANAKVSGTHSEFYDISYSSRTVRATIHRKVVNITAPPSAANLTYNGTAQALIDASSLAVDVPGVQVEYARSESGPYSAAIPTETSAGRYTVWYRIQETSDYTGLDPVRLDVEIGRKPANPTIALSGLTQAADGSCSCIYDGNAKEPAVTLTESGVTIPADQYTVSYSDNVDAGNATVTVTARDSGNYIFTVTTQFKIEKEPARVVTPPEAAGDPLIFNTRDQKLVTAGAGYGGTMVYSSDGTNFTDQIPTGKLPNEYKVYFKVAGDSNHSDSPVDSVTVCIDPKPVKDPTVRLLDANGDPKDNYIYDGTPKTPTVVVMDGNDTIADEEYAVTYRDNTNAGTATVIISDLDGGSYSVNGSATFVIDKAAANVTPPKVKTGLQYNGDSQGLIEAGSSSDGTVVYSVNGGNYFADIPTARAVGQYVIAYKVLGDANHNDTTPVTLGTVTIGRNTVTTPAITLSSNTFRYNGSEQKPTVIVRDDKGILIPEDEYIVEYPDSGMVDVGDYTVKVTTPAASNYDIQSGNTRTFHIVPADQEAISISGTQAQVRYGDVIQLGVTGGTGSGTITWTITDGSGNAVSSTISGAGLLTVKDVGVPIRVTATRSAGSNYSDVVSDVWEFSAARKQVTAVVTAEDRVYSAGDTAVTVHAAVPGGELVSDDSITISNLTGTFADANAGTDKKVTINSGSVTVTGKNAGNYEIIYPAVTASILKAETSVPTVTPNTLVYTGSARQLVSGGAGTVYSNARDGVYSDTVPTGTGAGAYTVWYKALGDANHNDSASQSVTVTISPKQLNPVNITLSGGDVQVDASGKYFCVYDGSEKRPDVTIRDSSTTVPASEYTVSYSSNRNVGAAIVTVTSNGGNYVFDEQTVNFDIVGASQAPLSIVNKPAAVYYGDAFNLSAMGGSGSGDVKWSIAESSVARIDSSGLVTVTGTGAFTVKAYREGTDGYNDSNTDSVTFTAAPKAVMPTVTADSKPYDGKTDVTLRAVWKDGDLVGSDTIALTVSGAFETGDAGENRTVRITGSPSGLVDDKYIITWPENVKASIYKVDVTLKSEPKAAAGLIYDGNPHALVIGGETTGNIGTIVYSTKQNGVYSEDIPTGTNGGTYTVWYKVADSINYNGIPATELEVEIARAAPVIESEPTASGTEGQQLRDIALTGGKADVPGEFAWKDSDTTPVDGGKYDVIFTPDDTTNYEPHTFKIAVTVQPVTDGSSGSGDGTGGTDESGDSADGTGTGGTGASGDSTSGTGTGGTGASGDSTSGTGTGGTGASGTGTSGTGSDAGSANTNDASSAFSVPTRTTVQNGTASTVVSAADGSSLVREAVASQSRNVVIKPEIASDVTKSEVFIPSSTISQLSSATDAALTVSSPIADVTISNTALDTLGQAGGDISVVTEKTEQAVTLTLSADGEVVEQVPGGLTLTVPAENAGPGAVAVLVHDDGSREVVRKSLVEDGMMSIPLSGSATVEIVDNSKDFTDVPPESWAADAVAFASAHELFGGTSETTFSPDQAMSRGMLAAVLYRLDGSPESDQTDAFSDVSSDAWYAEGVAWAVENGIAGGYGDGQFGPDDSITREQFVVMLWRYAGSPETSGQVLDFADADQVSGYAQQALCWAVENGIMRGADNGKLDPGGIATRAQAAQLLKNFMENT